jgi:D-aspartate ligase
LDNLPVVLTSLDRPATLGIARSLGRRGIPVHGIDTDPIAFGAASRYIDAHILPEAGDAEGQRLQYLLDLGKQLGRAVLYPLKDDDVILCSRERKALEKYYLYVMPDHPTVVNLLTKDGLTRIAQSCGVAVPRMVIPTDISGLKEIAEQLSYPVIIKPMFSPSWLRPEIIEILRDDPLSSPPKVALCADTEALINAYLKISQYDSRVIIQEVIPGEDQRLVYFCFYLDRQSVPLATFAGRKLRILPVGFGSASYVRSFYDQALEEISLNFLKDVSYKGLGGLEFKKDPRDESYKLIEFNVRFGMWDALGARCGIDIPYISYCDAIGLPVQPQNHYRENIAWVDLQRDLRAFMIYRKRKQINTMQWLKSLRGEKDWSVYSRDDWKPAIYEGLKLFERPLSAVKRRLLPRNSTATKI